MELKDLKVIFMGTPDFAVPILKYLIDNTNVILVVTQPDKVVGREKKLSLSPVKKVALESKIDVFQPNKIKLEHEIISEINPDLIVTAAYGQIIPKDILDIPKYGCINIHGSLLPKYRGASPIQFALLNGDKETGITIMYMDEKMDTGNIIASEKILINDDDNLETLFNKLSLLGKNLLANTLPSIIDGSNDSIKQDDDNASYTRLLTRDDEHIDFNDDGKNIINKIRAFSPKPYAFFYLNNLEIKVVSAKFIEKKSEAGRVYYFKKSMQIGCKDGVIDILKVKPFGKKEMDVSAFLNGIKKGDNDFAY